MIRRPRRSPLFPSPTLFRSAGGAVVPLGCLEQLRAITGERGVPVHIDGARLFNAAVALGVPASAIARHGDSVCFCVTKGDRKSTRLNSSHLVISYAVFCLKK